MHKEGILLLALPCPIPIYDEAGWDSLWVAHIVPGLLSIPFNLINIRTFFHAWKKQKGACKKYATPRANCITRRKVRVSAGCDARDARKSIRAAADHVEQQRATRRHRLVAVKELCSDYVGSAAHWLSARADPRTRQQPFCRSSSATRSQPTTFMRSELCSCQFLTVGSSFEFADIFMRAAHRRSSTNDSVVASLE